MISLEELAILANTNMITEDAAMERMRNHQKVQWDPSTDLYSYKVCATTKHACRQTQRYARSRSRLTCSRPWMQAEVLVNSKDAIIHEIQKLSKRGAGVSVKVLKESWKGSAEAIKELEEEGLVLVMRAGKNDEKNAKFVFWNAQSRAEAEEMKVDDG